MNGGSQGLLTLKLDLHPTCLASLPPSRQAWGSYSIFRAWFLQDVVPGGRKRRSQASFCILAPICVAPFVGCWCFLCPSGLVVDTPCGTSPMARLSSRVLVWVREGPCGNSLMKADLLHPPLSFDYGSLPHGVLLSTPLCLAGGPAEQSIGKTHQAQLFSVRPA